MVFKVTFNNIIFPLKVKGVLEDWAIKNLGTERCWRGEYGVPVILGVGRRIANLRVTLATKQDLV